MSVSIIIPTLNEAPNLQRLLPYLYQNTPEKPFTEIIIADNQSTDATVTIAQNHQAKVIENSGLNRATQMNKGAQIAQGEVLYFLHADTFPPPHFISFILEAVNAGYPAGAFKLQFDWDHWFLIASAWFTRWNCSLFRFGDQSLFVTRKLFRETGGFQEKLCLMEDQDIARRLKKQGNFLIIREPVITSARKYRENGVYYQQALYSLIWLFYYLGINPKRLQKWLQ